MGTSENDDHPPLGNIHQITPGIVLPVAVVALVPFVQIVFPVPESVCERRVGSELQCRNFLSLIQTIACHFLLSLLQSEERSLLLISTQVCRN